MQEYYFMFALALIYTVFASIHDIRKREVSNWLNFSFLAFALVYRFFYSVSTRNFKFFILGVLGFLAFYVAGQIFYYSKGFGGGDAKLLRAFGAILPYSNYSDIFILWASFLLLLFLIGAVYSLLYSLIYVYRDRKKFATEFRAGFTKLKKVFYLSIFVGLVIIILLRGVIWIYLCLFVICLPLIYIYLKALDKCMTRLVDASELSEGDWLEKEIKTRERTIRKTVHGLSLEDLRLLRKYKIKALIKEGVPFAPAFLLTWIIMGSFFLFSELSVFDLLVSLL